MSVKGTVTHLILLSCLLQGVRWEVFFSIHRKTKVGKKQNHFWFGFIMDYVRRDIWKVTLTILEPSGMLLMWDAATSRWRRCKEKQMRDECEIYWQALQKDWFLSHICAFKYRAAFAIYCIDIQLQNSMFWKKLFMFTQVVNCRLVACNCHFPQSEWVSRRRHCQHSWQLTTLVHFRCRLVQRCGGVTLWSVHVTCWGPPLRPVSLKAKLVCCYQLCLAMLVLLVIVCPHEQIKNNSKQTGRSLLSVSYWGTKPNRVITSETSRHTEKCCIPSGAFSHAK